MTLENVTVLGEIVVCGAGESNQGESSVLLRNVENVKNVSGAEVEQNELGTVLKVNADLSDVVVTL